VGNFKADFTTKVRNFKTDFTAIKMEIKMPIGFTQNGLAEG
jgi:hypothetical protein